MPVQDSEIKQKKSEPTEDLDETKRKQIANQQEKTTVQKSGKLLPFLNAKAEQQTNRIDNINGNVDGRFKEKFKLPDRIRSGERNDTLYRYGCSLQSRGYSDEKISDILRGQLSDGDFRAHADFVIDNSGDEEYMHHQIDSKLGEC